MKKINIEELKKYWSKKVDDEFVEFIEYLENELKDYAKLVDYNYALSNDINYHNYAFEITKKLTVEDIKKIESIINTYDEGSITRGAIHLGSIYVTIYGDN